MVVWFQRTNHKHRQLIVQFSFENKVKSVPAHFKSPSPFSLYYQQVLPYNQLFSTG